MELRFYIPTSISLQVYQCLRMYMWKPPQMIPYMCWAGKNRRGMIVLSTNNLDNREGIYFSATSVMKLFGCNLLKGYGWSTCMIFIYMYVCIYMAEIVILTNLR